MYIFIYFIFVEYLRYIWGKMYLVSRFYNDIYIYLFGMFFFIFYEYWLFFLYVLLDRRIYSFKNNFNFGLKIYILFWFKKRRKKIVWDVLFIYLI